LAGKTVEIFGFFGTLSCIVATSLHKQKLPRASKRCVFTFGAYAACKSEPHSPNGGPAPHRFQSSAVIINSDAPWSSPWAAEPSQEVASIWAAAALAEEPRLIYSVRIETLEFPNIDET
jgi:hypothetical protein